MLALHKKISNITVGGKRFEDICTRFTDYYFKEVYLSFVGCRLLISSRRKRGENGRLAKAKVEACCKVISTYWERLRQPLVKYKDDIEFSLEGWQRGWGRLLLRRLGRRRLLGHLRPAEQEARHKNRLQKVNLFTFSFLVVYSWWWQKIILWSWSYTIVPIVIVGKGWEMCQKSKSFTLEKVRKCIRRGRATQAAGRHLLRVNWDAQWEMFCDIASRDVEVIEAFGKDLCHDWW